MPEPQQRTLNGVLYSASQTGPAGAPALLLLHGFTGSGENWADHQAVFSEQFSVVSVDILGHGRSASPPDPNRYTMSRVAADLIALLDQWQITQTALLGYSMVEPAFARLLDGVRQFDVEFTLAEPRRNNGH